MSTEGTTTQFSDREVDYLKRKFGFNDDEIEHIPVEEGRKVLDSVIRHSREPNGDDRAMEEASVVWDDVTDVGNISSEDRLLGERLKQLADAREAEKAEMEKAMIDGDEEEPEDEPEED